MIQAISLNVQPYLPYVPLLSPAINHGTYQIDHQLIRKRIGWVALICFAAMSLAFLYFPPLIPVGLLWWPIAFLDEKLSNVALDRLVVQEYLDRGYPSKRLN